MINKKYSHLSEKSYDRGVVTFSGELPVILASNHPIKDIRSEESYWSETLGYPVVILANIENELWSMLHKDSVVMADRNSCEHQILGIWSLVADHSKSVHVIGLWDGIDVDSLFPIIQSTFAHNRSFEALRGHFVFALQSRSPTKKECTDFSIGVKSLTRNTYFIDHVGGCLLHPEPCAYIVNSDTGQRAYYSSDDLVRVSNIDDSLAAITSLCYSSRGIRFYQMNSELLKSFVRYPITKDNIVMPSSRDNSPEVNAVELTQVAERDFYKVFAQTGFYFEELILPIGMTPFQVHQKILNAIDSGDVEYIVGCDRDGYSYPRNIELTLSGRSKAMKKLSRRMKRTTASNLVNKLIERSVEMESLEFIGLTVSRISIFGSYTDEYATDFGDLDCVIEFVYRPDNIVSKGDFTMDEMWEYNIECYRKACDAFDRKEISYKPPKFDLYSGMVYMQNLAMKHLKRSNHAISCHHTPDEVMQLESVKEVLVIFENGQEIKPYMIAPTSLWNSAK